MVAQCHHLFRRYTIMSNLLYVPLTLTDSLPNDCPNVWTMATVDSYGQVTAVGYLSDLINTSAFPANVGDIIYIRYDVNGTPGTYKGILDSAGTIVPTTSIDSITGNSGGAIFPTSNNITFVGNANKGVTVNGTPATSTLQIELTAESQIIYVGKHGS